MTVVDRYNILFHLNFDFLGGIFSDILGVLSLTRNFLHKILDFLTHIFDFLTQNSCIF